MIDLHMHSNFSDGTDDLKTLIENVIKHKIKTFALTDHDTAEGCRQIYTNQSLQTLLNQNGVEFISGAEWTCILDKQKMHILAYGFDPFDENIVYLENEMRKMLNCKDEYRMVKLNEMGYEFSQKSLQYLAEKENIRTLDFAKCLVDDGYFDNVHVAIQDCIDLIKIPFQCKFNTIEAIKILKKAGAVVIWAHPIYDIRRDVVSFEKVEDLIELLKPVGLDGIECFYSLYSKEEIDKLVAIAKKHKLLISCGSDYHGENKDVKLGSFSSDNIKVDEKGVIECKKIIMGE